MKEIELTQGKLAFVDDDDYPELSKYKWYYHKDGYAITGIWQKGKNTTKQVKMHHMLIPKIPKGYCRDHINGNRIDNRRENLRVVTRQFNNINREKAKRQCTSKFKGVVWVKSESVWRSCIRLNGKTYYIGRFRDEEDAARAYDKRALELFGEHARLNFPYFDYTNYHINKLNLAGRTCKRKPKLV